MHPHICPHNIALLIMAVPTAATFVWLFAARFVNSLRVKLRRTKE